MGLDEGGARESRSERRRRLTRRRFLQRLALAAAVPVVGGAGYEAWRLEQAHSAAAPAPDRTRHPAAKPASKKKPAPGDATGFTRLQSGVVVPTAAWVVAENNRPGSTGWVVRGKQVAGGVEGFADRVSTTHGETVTLYVSTVAASFSVQAYRMGYYQGLGGRLVWESGPLPGKRQPPHGFYPTVNGAVANMVECHWSPSATFTVGASWPPGDYLLKLVGSGGQQQYVPLCVRDDASNAAYVVQNSVTTWQAYNRYGGYSLYLGPTPGGGAGTANRSRIVSFDRPYPLYWANGAADFIGNEYPVVYMAERLGLDVTYWTDVDLSVRPELALRHRCLLSLGHDEYWSSEMRDGATAARDKGVNLAFLGANACYRHIRLAPSPLGPDRRQICYKTRFMKEDPMYGVDNARVTANWPTGPDPRPESSLIGDMYASLGAKAPFVVTDAAAWPFSGTGFTQGQSVAGLIRGEFDSYQPSLPSPRNLTILAHSPIANRGPGYHSDMTYYTQPGGGGVFASGMASFVYSLSDTSRFPTNVVPGPVPGVTAPLLRIMEKVLSVFGRGPASATHPSVANWQQYYG
ncbi:MAG: N,N-dimethylformamidase beta subunit family domain-containing protein [Acidimicrobiales bacterium]